VTYLNTTDLVIFLVAFNIILSDKERRIFMNPIRDREQEDIGIRGLILVGVNIMLVGVDLSSAYEKNRDTGQLL
jgi:hypothetical protein